MSAAKRVAHAAETVRARWERQVSTDPQTEAAQALEDTGQLLDSEVAAELVAFRKERELAEAVAEHGAIPMPVGPVPQLMRLRVDEVERAYTFDTAALKRRIAELETGIAWRDAERDRWAGVHYLIEKAIDKGWSTLDTLDVEAELGPEVAPVLAAPVAEPSCLCPPADQPGPHQVGCPLAEVPRLSERPVNELTAAFTPMPVLREVLDGEHYAYVHHEHRTPHDLPELGGTS